MTSFASRVALPAAIAIWMGLSTTDGMASTFDVLAQASLPLVQARPDTGSRIRRGLVELNVAATDPYDRLTTKQKEEFLSHFSNLPEGYEPPYPAEGLLPVAKKLAFALADGPVSPGEIFVTVHVDERGEAVSTKVYATPSARISRETAIALMATKYKPASCAGKPCESEFPFTAQLTVE